MGSLLTALAIALAPQLPAAPAIDVPDGYRADRYATGLTRPTAMAWSRDGRLFVAENRGRIVVVEPGSARPRTFVRGFTEPLGLVFHRGALFVSTRGVIWRVDPETKLRRAVGRDLPFGWHQQDSIVVGPDGRLYFGNGSTCDVCREEDRRAAAILSIRPDGSDLRIEARGLRNPFGLAFRPGTSRLYVSVNGRDDLGEWNPAESVVVVRRGAHFGWPACWPDWRTRELAGRCRG